MPDPLGAPTIRRILVALDASPHSEAAVEAAAELAASLEAELMGLFVEDVDLLNAAAVPFVREVRRLQVVSTELSHAVMQEQLRVQARRAQRVLEACARRYGISAGFNVSRGHVPDEVLRALSDADLLILGQAGLRYRSRGRVGSTVRSVLAEAPTPVLVLRHGLRLGTGVFVLYDGAPQAEKALRLAADLARRRADGVLTVLVWDADPDARQQTLRAVRARVAGTLPVLNVWPLATTETAHLGRLLREARAGLLVLSADSPLLPQPDVPPFLYAVECPVLVVR